MRVGLDWGTTNSSAAIYTANGVELLPLDPEQPNPGVLRSALFIGRDGQASLGRPAIDRYTEGNVGREIVYERIFLGTERMTFADIGTVDQALFADVDANAPGRLFLSLKMALPDRSFLGTDVFGTRWTLEELIGLMLRGIHDRTEALLGEPVTEWVIGRPVHYADPAGDELAIERMHVAAALAGLPPIRFIPEPVAAALHYALQASKATRVLVFDFGGGTLDLTVMETTPDGAGRVLATEGVAVGGDLLDRRIVMGKLLPHFGAGATLGPRGLPLPAFLLDHLDGWQSIVELHKPKALEVIDQAIMMGDRKPQLQALRALVRENYGLPLYEMVERQKRVLSEQPHVMLGMHAAEIQFDERLERWDFERMIGPDVRAVDACIERVLVAAGVQAAAIDVVVRTGGSSRIPRFVRLLVERFGAAKLHDMDAFTSVASGLGIAAAQGIGVENGYT